jgi:hypothetical protein
MLPYVEDGGSSMMTQTNPTAPIPSPAHTPANTTNPIRDATMARVVEKQDPIKAEMVRAMRLNPTRVFRRGCFGIGRDRVSVCAE